MDENIVSEDEVPSAGTSNSPDATENRKRLRTQDVQQGTSSTPDTINDLDVSDASSSRAAQDNLVEPESTDEDFQPYTYMDGDSTCSSLTNSTDDEGESLPRRRRHCMWLGTISDLDSSMSTALNDTDSDSDHQEHPMVQKEKPPHRWFLLPEVQRRQLGTPARLQCADLFQRRCYGSLHCVQRLELMYKMEKHQGCVNSLNFHPNGSYLASGSDDLKVVIWDWQRGRALLTFDTKHRGNVFQSKFLHLSGDLHVVTCSTDGMVRMHQVSAQEGLRSSRKLGRHYGPCHKLSVMHDQPHMILSAGEDGVVYQFDVRQKMPEKLLTVKRDSREVALYSISTHPINTNEFCVSGRDHIVRIYDQRKIDYSSKPMKVFFPKKKKDKYTGLHVTCAIYNYNGTEILASYNDDDIYIFDTHGPTGSFVHQYQGHRNGATIKGVNFFGPKSEFVVSGSDCGNIYFWERNTESVVNWMSGDENGVVNCIEPHPQLPFLATSGLDWDVKMWVPSSEDNPQMTDLLKTMKANSKARQGNYDSESQMLWMLWRHLRSSTRVQNFRSEVWLDSENTNSSSGHSNPSDANEHYSNNEVDEEEEEQPDCNPS